MMRRLTAILLGFAAATLTTTSATTDVLKTRLRQEIKSVDQPLSGVVGMVFSSAGVSGGVISVSACEDVDRRDASLSLAADLPVEQALESVRPFAPGLLEWQTSDGIFNVSVDGRRPAILDLQIDGFEWQSPGETISAVVDRLFQTTRVRQRLKELGLNPGRGFEIGLQKPPRINAPTPTPVRRSIGSSSVLTALNSVVLSYRRGSSWQYDEVHCGSGGTYVVGAR